MLNMFSSLIEKINISQWLCQWAFTVYAATGGISSLTCTIFAPAYLLLTEKVYHSTRKTIVMMHSALKSISCQI